LTFRARIVESGRMPAFNDARRACCDAGAVRFPLEVRNRRPGDRYRPLGAPGSKTLKEILRARGIAEAERGTIPVFLSGGKVLWAPGLPVAEEFKVGPRTRTVLLVERV
jgi:tRNA(Ile)-lysidine synthase